MARQQDREMTPHERRFYKRKMKAIKEALQNGDEQLADRHAIDLMDFFGEL